MTPGAARSLGEGGAKGGAGPQGPITLTVDEAILLALERNRAFRVQRFGSAGVAAREDEAAAAFDTKFTAEAEGSKSRGVQLYGPSAGVDSETTSPAAAIGLVKPLSWGGEFSVNVAGQDTSYSTRPSIALAEVAVELSQPLARGAGRRVNLASIRQARLDTRASQYELRGLAEALIAEVESVYWDAALAERKIEIYEESLKLARKQLAETSERILIGRLAETELAAPRAEVALRREALITARGTLAKAKLRLARLTGSGPGRWEAEIVLKEAPTAPKVELGDVISHVEAALRKRPDLGQARLAFERGELEIVKTKNGLLPRLDLFVKFGKTGFAESFGDSVGELGGDAYDFSAGVSLEYAIGNRSARARHERALFGRDQAEEALRNLEEIVQVDVRTAYIEVRERGEQVTATRETRRFREEALRAETEKFRVGKSTTLLVAQAGAYLVESRISEIEAVVNLLTALVGLHLTEGMLLERRGISASRR